MRTITSAPIRSAAALVGAALLGSAPAFGQGVLPASGVDIRTGDLRSQVQGLFTPPTGGAAEPGWTITPAIDVTGAWASPVQPAGYGTGRNNGSDFYTIISPSVLIRGAGARVSGTLLVAPELRAYATHGSLNMFSTNFAGQAHVIAVPDTLFVDVTGSSMLQSRSDVAGGSAYGSRSDAVQTTSFSIAPYAVHRFGDTGTGEVGYTLTETLRDSFGSARATPFAPAIPNGTTTTHALHANFRLGEAFGRTFGGFSAQYTTSQGGGFGDSTRTVAGFNGGYVFNRTWAALFGFGYQELNYSYPSRYHLSEPTWSAGVRWTPNADSSASLTYGHHDGGDAFGVDASYAPTARLRLSASYSEAITTGPQAYQNALGYARLNSAGQLIDSRTGLPLTFINGFYGTQGISVYRSRITSVSANLLGDRNVYTATVQRFDNTTLAGTATGAPASSSGYTFSAGVQRELRPDVSASLTGQVGTQVSNFIGKRQTQDTLATVATLQYRYSETLALTFQYSFQSTTSNVASYSQDRHVVLASVHKSF